MKIKIFIKLGITLLVFLIGIYWITTGNGDNMNSAEEISLADPSYDSDVSIEEALQNRRSQRSYQDKALTLEEVSQLVWAAQGITNDRGFRTAPSAGATYPLELYVVAGNVENLMSGIYKYEPNGHKLTRIAEGDNRNKLANAALGQSSIRDGAINLVFSAVYQRTARRYGERAKRYVHMEVGHAAQNVYLQAESLELGTVVIGAFDDKSVREMIQMPEEEQPLYIMPVGKSK
jgi:SagB-type dehydrogenase family enzyme